MDSLDTQESSKTSVPLSDTLTDNAVDSTVFPTSDEKQPGEEFSMRAGDGGGGADKSTQSAINRPLRTWGPWFRAFKRVLPVYVGIHLAFFVTTCLSVLFVLPDFSWDTRPIYTLWQVWHRWDTGFYLRLATDGYDASYKTVFFPLYPLLERALMVVTHNPFTAGLFISNVAGLVMLVVLYRLVQEDFDAELGVRTVLYLSVFPTAFFFAAAYNESLALCLALLSFYHMRRGHWWLAGLFGLFTSLTRSAGLLLLLPFCYEYLRQHCFKLKTARFDMLGGLGFPVGTAIFGTYCYFRFHDFLAFSHAESSVWGRTLQVPWYGIEGSILAIRHSYGILSFHALRNLTDLLPDLLVLALIVLIFVGPWRFHRSLWSYGIYAATLYLVLQFFSLADQYFPLQSVSRYVLEIFPAFILLARIGKNATFNMSYLMVSGAVLFFLLTQFLTGHWVI